MTQAAARPRDAAFSNSTELVRHDGRNRRSAETRRKIIEAAKAMITETGTAPTVVGVAKRADVSVRSVFQHFGDVESLFVTVFDNVAEGVERLQAPTSGSLPDRIDIVVDFLAGVFDKVVPLRIAAGQFGETNPALLERREAARGEVANYVNKAFAPELGRLDAAAHDELKAAIDAVLSVDAWIMLRRASGLGYEPAKAVVRRMLSALFDHARADGERVQLAHD
jgi:AcrR family transcriptional regulator